MSEPPPTRSDGTFAESDFACAPVTSVVADHSVDSSRSELLTLVNDLQQRNEALADAVVNSAEIIDELEQTKLQLAEARGAAETAHQNSQRMAETIFEGTRDAMMVLDAKLRLVSANQNARTMFRLPSNDSDSTGGVEVVEHLQLEFSSTAYTDWFRTLQNPHIPEGRIELYRCRSDFEDQLEASEWDEQSGSQPRQWIALSMSELEGDLSQTRYLLSAHDITRRKRIEERFQHQALYDNVTRLPNRRFFVRQVEQLLADSNGNTSFSICFLDLDNFKTVNDTLGHAAGDDLLAQVAERIQSTTREDSFLARFGGDEFAILCPGLTIADAAAVAERIVEVLNKPFVINDNSVYIGASIGMTQFPNDGSNVESLLQNADVAMYSAKDGGRNRFHQFTPQLAGEIRERQQLLDDLRVSLDEKSIALEYQPKWCLHEDRFAGLEVLLRWERDGDPVSASHLVEVAECSGLISPLGDLVIEVATRQIVQWQNELSLNEPIAINVSPQQLADPGFVARFLQIIERTGIAPSTIELEVTETAMIENFRVAFQRFAELQEIGVSIAIDDFGTGYSSLSYLKSLPVSTLKIDRMFVKDLPDDPKAVAVVEAILALGRGLELRVVAEGVETEEQRQFLATSGCDQMQGFLLSRSITPAKFPEWLADAKRGIAFSKGAD